jgi:hypothetical protein
MPLTNLGPSRAIGAAAAALLVAVASCDSPLDPTIQIVPSETVVELRAVRGTTSPVTRTITVRNAGSGRLGPVSCPANPVAWLTCEVTNGTVVTLSASPAGLVTNPQPVAVPLAAPGGTGTLEVSLVLEQPVLTVSPATLAFTAMETGTGTTPGSGTVTVTNTGAGTRANLGLITCAPATPAPNVSCSVDQEGGLLTVTVNPSGVGPGTHVYPLTVEAQHAAVSQTVAVSLSVAPLPRIGLSRESVRFEAVRGTTATIQQTVTVSNTGGGTLSAPTCPASPAAWLSCSVAGSTVTLTANPSGLTGSPESVAVSISSANAVNSPQSLEVRLDLLQPVLALSRSALSFTASVGGTTAVPSSDTLTVTNTGAGTLQNLGAITCVPPENAPVTCELGTAGRLVVRVNPTGLTRGAHVYPVAVSAAHSSITRILNVTLTIDAPPTIRLTPSAVHFTAIRGSTSHLTRTVTVTNAGIGTLGQIGCSASPATWLSCQVSADSTELILTANPSGLTSSPGEVNVLVTATNAFNVSLPVTLTIEQPILSVSASTLTFGGADPANQVVTFDNVGAGNRANLGTVTCTGADAVTCTVNQTNGQITVSVDTSGLDPGSHVRTIMVNAPHAANSPVAITVVMNVP